MKNILSAILFLILFLKSASAQTPAVIPFPENIKMGDGYFSFDANTKCYFEKGTELWKSSVNILQQKLRLAAGIRFNISNQPVEKNVLKIRRSKDTLPAEGYRLHITHNAVDIEATEPTGVFYAIQTLMQLLPPEIESRQINPDVKWDLPIAEIMDKPAFQYRGLMLDVSRHYLPFDFLKKMVDAMAYQKLNRLHLHLTDDQGWRMEIKKYPKLTSVGSVRSGTLIGRYPGKGYDHIEHKGFYTQQQLRELVQYASERHVVIIPEIELPGHSSAAIAAYPELSCDPSTTKQVQQTWGVFNDVFCPTEYTFQFIQDVLDEVMSVFPSPYIHIGGDECPKESWKRSSFCQDLIKSKELKDEHGLQSYFIQRVEKYINGKGRKIIGWDEILEGGLAPNATVMSWRGISGGVEAAKQMHDVIMSPVDNCYLNLYQSEDPSDSIAWGGLTSLKKVYNYDPMPAILKPEERKYIKGVQANLWTEYINSPALAEFMLFPRLLAIAESGWSVNKPGFEHFSERVAYQFSRLKKMGINHSSHLYELSLKQEFLPAERKLRFELKGTPQGKNIYYQLNNGATPSYDKPFFVDGEGTIKVLAKLNGLQTDAIYYHYNINLASGKATGLKQKADPPYHRAGDLAWANGILGSDTRYTDDEWLGWNGKDFEGLLNLGVDSKFSSASIRFFNAPGSWVYLPATVEVYASSDGIQYNLISKQSVERSADAKVFTIALNFQEIKARYVKVVAKNHGIIQQGAPGEGNPAWLFVDEVVLK